MLNLIDLEILTQLRERAGLTQADAAVRCGLQTQMGRISVSKWESGAMKPRPSRRNHFIGYLWDDLQLREEPELFKDVWGLLVEEWGWFPLSRSECDRWGLPYSVSADTELTVSKQASAYQLKRLIEVIGYVGNLSKISTLTSIGTLGMVWPKRRAKRGC